MNFQDLHELLRLELLRRIERGSLTGTSLALQVGFKQGHISNFLNRKRSLSLDGLDRVLAAQNLSLEQLVPLELNASAMGTPASHPMDAIPVVSASTAMEAALVPAEAVIETLHVSPSRLGDFRSRPSPQYAHWQRFVAIRTDPEQAAAMDPVLGARSTVVLDRHSTTLASSRLRRRSLFAVRNGAGLALRYVDFEDRRLILRPLSADYPVQLIALADNETPADYLVGRVCLVSSEL